MSGTPAPSLANALKAIIALDGPIAVDRFMALALGHPTLGYYATRDPFGPAGDFVTAPETSQMFGELIGAWAATVWTLLGRPRPVRLIELGPGRGTLMVDALKAARAWPAFRAALDPHLVETSPVLREAQRAALAAGGHAAGGHAASWHATFEDVPPGPAIVLANEFFDALPVRHYVRTRADWRERQVGLAGDALVFGLAPAPEAALRLAAPEGAMLEVGVAARRLAGVVARRLVAEGGAALIVDYGYEAPRFGETLQAVRRHRFVDPLAEPGEADLTAHVDFAALAGTARHAGAVVHGPTPQGAFLRRLGIEARADALLRHATPAQARDIATALARLVGDGDPDRPGMGRLFKAMAFAAPGLPDPPGFCDAGAIAG